MTASEAPIGIPLRVRHGDEEGEICWAMRFRAQPMTQTARGAVERPSASWVVVTEGQGALMVLESGIHEVLGIWQDDADRFDGADDGPAVAYIEYRPGAWNEAVSSGCQLLKPGTVFMPCDEVPTAFQILGVYDSYREALASHEAIARQGGTVLPTSDETG